MQNFKKKGLPTHYFPDFYGDFLGPKYETKNSRSVQLVYRSKEVHKSLVTLIFTADTVSFVENRQ